MKYIKLIILAAFLSTMFTGCSYVSDSIEGRITDRASFSATAEFLTTPNRVKITWDKTDTSANFTGIEIYRSSDANDEYATYELVASRLYNDSGLSSGFTQTYTDTLFTTYTDATPATSGVFFYRVAFIHWDKDADERTYPTTDGNYPYYTDIDSISGYAKVVIP